MLESIRRLSRVAAGAAVVGLAAIAPLQAVTHNASEFASAAGSDACGPLVPKADGTTWTCSFVDDFNGRSLDSSKWVTGQTPFTGFRTGATCYVSSSKNINVRNGELRLTARRETHRLDCSGAVGGTFSTPYTGGLISTRGHFSQAYGRFEVRAKYPAVTVAGLHGGFWAYPLSLTYGAWPASGEIDIAEWWSNQWTHAMPSLHYTGSSAADSGVNCVVATPSSYHTYTMEWYVDVIRFFIDGAMCFDRTWTPDSPLVAPQPFDQPFNMILNMGVGTLSGFNMVSSSTPLPATYTVDYAKAWR